MIMSSKSMIDRRQFLGGTLGMVAATSLPRATAKPEPRQLVSPEFLRANVQKLFERTGWRGFVATAPASTLYLTGANIITTRLIPDRLAVVFWPRDGEPAFLVATVEENQARHESSIADVRTYAEFAKSPIHLLAETMKERRVSSGPVGLETHHLVAHYYDELRQALPNVAWASSDGQMERLRTVKTREEVELYRRSALATDRAIRTAFERAQPGTTEKEMANTMASALLENGADEVAFMVLAVGANTIDTHHLPGSYRAQRGDVVHVDFGGWFSGYVTDVARAAVIGKPTDEQKRWYGYMWEGVNTLIEAVKPGVTVGELYGLYQKTFGAWGLPTNRSLIGHSLGLIVHEYPILNATTDQVIEPDMILSIELAANANERERFHVEDLIHVTENGAELLSRSAPWEDLFSIG